MKNTQPAALTAGPPDRLKRPPAWVISRSLPAEYPHPVNIHLLFPRVVTVGAAFAITILAMSGCASTDTTKGGHDSSADRPEPTITSDSEPTIAEGEETIAYEHLDQVGDIGRWSDLQIGKDFVLATQSDGVNSYSLSGEHLGSLDTEGESLCSVATATESKAIYVLERFDTEAEGVEDGATHYELVTYDSALTEISRVEVALIPPVGNMSFECVDRAIALSVTIDGQGVGMTVEAGRFVYSAVTQVVTEVEYIPVAAGAFIAQTQGLCANCVNGLKSLTLVDPADVSEVTTYSSEMDAFRLVVDALDDTRTTQWFANGNSLVRQDSDVTYVLDLATRRLEKISFGGGALYYPPVLNPDETTIFIANDKAAVATEVVGSQRLWTQKNVSTVCGASDTQVAVMANDQYVLLDTSTGEQIDYSPDLDCGGAQWVKDGLFFDDQGPITAIVDLELPASS